MDSDHTYLSFTIKILNIINMWPNESKRCDFIKKYYILVTILLSIIAIMADSILQFYGECLLLFFFYFLSYDIISNKNVTFRPLQMTISLSQA